MGRDGLRAAEVPLASLSAGQRGERPRCRLCRGPDQRSAVQEAMLEEGQPCLEEVYPAGEAGQGAQVLARR